MPEATIPDLPFVEEWRVIEGFPHYAVSNIGRVKRIVPDRKGRLSGKPLRATVNSKFGHLMIALTGPEPDFNLRYFQVHVLVLLAFDGQRPTPEHESRHLDGVAHHNWITNLKWGTRIENADDRRIHGTDPVGERNPRATMTDAQALEILTNNPVPHGARSRQRGLYKKLCAQYNVSYYAVDQLFQRKTFKHLKV